MVVRVLAVKVGHQVDNLDPLSYLFRERVSRTCVTGLLLLPRVRGSRAIKDPQLFEIGRPTIFRTQGVLCIWTSLSFSTVSRNKFPK